MLPPQGPPRPSWSGRLKLLACFLGAYALACLLPALHLASGSLPPERWSGLRLAAMGWMGLLIGLFGWLANVLLLPALALALARKWIAASLFAGFAFLVSLDALRLAGRTIPADEGGVGTYTVRALGPAVWVWMASLLILVVGPLVLRARERRALEG